MGRKRGAGSLEKGVLAAPPTPFGGAHVSICGMQSRPAWNARRRQSHSSPPLRRRREAGEAAKNQHARSAGNFLLPIVLPLVYVRGTGGSGSLGRKYNDGVVLANGPRSVYSNTGTSQFKRGGLRIVDEDGDATALLA
ncbi:hypothetical protein MRX96_008294 [Rhipicephalus microplus]